MISKKDIVCIVVLYKPDASVIKNIKRYNNLVNEVILVDNSSEDNTELFESLDFIRYIPLKSNTGIAHAINIGIKKSEEPFIITMDQDSSINDGLINSYINFLNTKDNEKVGALTPQYNTDRNPAVAKDGTELQLLTMQSGTLFKRSTIEQIGYFDEDLFLDVVDWEYCLRMNSNGYQLIRVNKAVLDHKPAETREWKFGPLKVKYGAAAPIRYYYQARNLLWTAKKYHSMLLYKNILIKWLKIILLFDNKAAYLKAFRAGVRDANNNKLGKRE